MIAQGIKDKVIDMPKDERIRQKGFYEILFVKSSSSVSFKYLGSSWNNAKKDFEEHTADGKADGIIIDQNYQWRYFSGSRSKSGYYL